MQNNEDNCKIYSYEVTFNNENLTVSGFKFTVKPLEPFTDYELVMRNTLFNKTIRIDLKTKEGGNYLNSTTTNL